MTPATGEQWLVFKEAFLQTKPIHVQRWSRKLWDSQKTVRAPAKSLARGFCVLLGRNARELWEPRFRGAAQQTKIGKMWLGRVMFQASGTLNMLACKIISKRSFWFCRLVLSFFPPPFFRRKNMLGPEVLTASPDLRSATPSGAYLSFSGKRFHRSKPSEEQQP